MKDSLALQIFRFTGAPGEYLSQLEEELEFHLSEPASMLYREVEQHFHHRLLTELGQRVKEFKALSGVSLFSVATGGRLQGPGRTCCPFGHHALESLGAAGLRSRYGRRRIHGHGRR